MRHIYGAYMLGFLGEDSYIWVDIDGFHKDMLQDNSIGEAITGLNRNLTTPYPLRGAQRPSQLFEDINRMKQTRCK